MGYLKIICILVLSLKLIACSGEKSNKEIHRTENLNDHSSKPSRPNGYALMIATSEIDRERVRSIYFREEAGAADYGSLEFAPHDIKNFGFILQKTGFQPKNIIDLSGKKIFKSEVFRAFKTLQDSAKSGDLVVIYFTGHGDQILDKEGDEPDLLDEAFVVGDDLITDDQINEQLHRFKQGARLVMLIDACHSGTGYSILKAPYQMPPSKRQQLIQKSDRRFEDEFTDMGLLNKDYSLCQIQRSESLERKIKLIYFGACADEQSAKASILGSYFTSALLSKYKPPRNEWQRLNYQTLYCSILNISQEQSIHYQEVGDTEFSKTNKPLTIE